MDKTRTIPKKPRVSVDRSIERLRKQLTDFAPLPGQGQAHAQLGRVRHGNRAHDCRSSRRDV